MEENKIISPCISVCKTDPISGFCYGCGRTNDDKKMWKDENTSNNRKISNLQELKKRLNGWQLEAFNASYESKKSSGLSLIKKKLAESKNH